jgi:hypothetical protein
LLNDPAFRDLPYDIVPQHQLTELSGRILGLLDLHFKHRQSQRDYFAFEAKRLHVTRPGGSFSNEHSIYVGNEGMMAFVDGQYSKGLPAGGMLGYVMDGKTKKAWDGLEAHIEKRRGELKLIPASNLQSRRFHTLRQKECKIRFWVKQCTNWIPSSGFFTCCCRSQHRIELRRARAAHTRTDSFATETQDRPI